MTEQKKVNKKPNAVLSMTRLLVKNIIQENELKLDNLADSEGNKIIAQVETWGLQWREYNQKEVLSVENVHLSRYINITEKQKHLLEGIQVGKIYDMEVKANIWESKNSRMYTPDSRLRFSQAVLISSILSPQLEDVEIILKTKNNKMYQTLKKMWDQATKGKDNLKHIWNTTTIKEWNGISFGRDLSTPLVTFITSKPNKRLVLENSENKELIRENVEKDYLSVLIFKYDSTLKQQSIKEYIDKYAKKDGVAGVSLQSDNHMLTYVRKDSKKHKQLLEFRGEKLTGLNISVYSSNYSQIVDGDAKYKINAYLSITPIMDSPGLSVDEFEDYEATNASVSEVTEETDTVEFE